MDDYNPFIFKTLLAGSNPFSAPVDTETNPFSPPMPPESYNPFSREMTEENPFTRVLAGERSQVGLPIQGSRKDRLKAMLGDFLYNFGQGLREASKAAPGKEGMAGFAGALSAPYERQAFERKQALEEARQQWYEAQVRQADARAANMADAAARAWKEIESKIGEREARTKRSQYVTTPVGILDISGPEPKLIPGTGAKFQTEVTKEIADMLGLPSNLVGQRMSVQEINQMAAAVDRPLRIARTEEGVMSYNTVTGEKKKIGDIPPPRVVGMFHPQVNEYGEILGYYNPTTNRKVGQPEEFAGARRAGLPAGEVEKRVTLQNLLEDADFIERIAKENPKVIGPLAGRFASALHQYAPSVLQQMFPEYATPEVIEMFRVALNIRNQLLYALSGKQINEREYARLQQLVPQVTVSPEVFQGRLNQYRHELQRVVARRRGKPIEADTVRIKGPDGSIWTVPRNKVDEALKRGGVEVP